MSVRLSETQLALLSAASRNEGGYLAPYNGARLAPARKAAAKLVEAGLVREVRAKGGAPIWRRDEQARCDFALKLTVAGKKALKAMAAPNDRVGATEESREKLTVKIVQRREVEPAARLPAQQIFDPVAGVVARAGTKIAGVVSMLERKQGATINELMMATGWLPHTTRAALTGLRKRGFVLDADRSDKVRGSIYRIAAAAATAGSNEATGVGRVVVGAGGAGDKVSPAGRKGASGHAAARKVRAAAETSGSREAL